jgi:hypothetical protein
MKGGGMNDGLNPMVREGMLHDRSIGHRTDEVRLGAGRHVEADHDMTGRTEARCEEPAEPARRAGEKNAHYSYRISGWAEVAATLATGESAIHPPE